MIELKITRSIDLSGRVVIPVLIRKFLNKENEKKIEVDFFVDEDSDAVIIKRHKVVCEFCKSDNNLTKFNNIHICSNCLQELKKL